MVQGVVGRGEIGLDPIVTVPGLNPRQDDRDGVESVTRTGNVPEGDRLVRAGQPHPGVPLCQHRGSALGPQHLGDGPQHVAGLGGPRAGHRRAAQQQRDRRGDADGRLPGRTAAGRSESGPAGRAAQQRP